MGNMRNWLDHFSYEADTFQQSKRGAGVVFLLEFKIESEAVTFGAAFRGGIKPHLHQLPLESAA